jgi:RNA polymerase sigma-70 factor, ECF subfamily
MTSFASPASFIGFDNSWVGSILSNRGAAHHGETRRATPASPTTVAPVSAPQDDAELLERVAGGDPRAYRAIVERHMRGVHAFVYRMLGSRAEAEEVCQESFLRLWQQADTFVARAKPSTWLYRVAHNLAIDRLRRRRETSHSAGIEEVPNSERPSLHVYDKQVAEAVERALSELPERQRAAISLVFYQGLSNAEAADVIGVKVRALESLLARGRQQLRERLQDYRTREGNDV